MKEYFRPIKTDRLITPMNQVFSIMKGIAIISVVARHAYIRGFSENVFNQYHLAVFFFISSHFFKEKYFDSPLDFIKKRIKLLYIPFIELGILFILSHNFLYQIHLELNCLSIQVTKRKLFTLSSFDIVESYMDAIWYCPALCISSILILFALKPFKCNEQKQLFTTLSIYILGGILIRHVGHYFLFIHQSMMYSFIILTVFEFRKNESYFQNKRLLWFLPIFSLTFLLITTYYGINARLQLHMISWYKYLYIPIISTIGCIGLYSLIKLISTYKIGKITAHIGEYSFSIICLHFLVFRFINLLQRYLTNRPISEAAAHPYTEYNNILWYFIYLIAGVVISIKTTRIYQYSSKKFLQLPKQA